MKRQRRKRHRPHRFGEFNVHRTRIKSWSDDTPWSDTSKPDTESWEPETTEPDRLWPESKRKRR